MNIYIPKDIRTIFKWLLKGSAPGNDPRDVLRKTVKITPESFVSCDGFVMFTAQNDRRVTDEGVFYIDSSSLSGKVNNVQAFPVEGFFPDYRNVIPYGKEPGFEIGVNPKYLAKALSGFDSIAKMVFYDAHHPIEIYGYSKDGTALYALVMPMHLEGEPGESIKNWRPQ
jgi:hypothetical protein